MMEICEFSCLEFPGVKSRRWLASCNRMLGECAQQEILVVHRLLKLCLMVCLSPLRQCSGVSRAR